ncbi:hypothetical protein [Stratiformator vulcanicus]|uniref:Homeodomain phBC6A51-type domain-containing protein n=1 Tax=Stratiformator vulcanicus TaxID=2527980 RepID=A0A517QX03_9PLAN|nr:hypothetical protein [Stratiformator vulcanicus]QDT36113.1 hypothetical protein Pan189_04680 [Stratiformator vulcanicus]
MQGEQPNESRCLTSDQQTLLIDVLARGGSPTAACSQLGVTFETYLATWAEDAAFRERLAAVTAALSQNVASALYRQAMEGSVSAQQFWLKSRPPLGWIDGDQDSEGGLPDDLNALTNDELERIADSRSVVIPSKGELPPARTDREDTDQ